MAPSLLIDLSAFILEHLPYIRHKLFIIEQFVQLRYKSDLLDMVNNQISRKCSLPDRNVIFVLKEKPDVAKVVDRRVQKTRQLLQEALTGLIAEKGYDSITIQHILDRANVGRSTFYAHFQDKEQLLHSCFDSLNGLFRAAHQAIIDG